MADLKISQLSAATTPLAGTEVLPIVQSGSTKKVATDDLTVKNVRSNATTGILQVAGPATGTTRVMTTPNANFTAARTDDAQTFAGDQTFSNDALINSVRVGRGGISPHSSDTCVGAGALAAKTGGFGATAVGNDALAALTTGQQIVAVGSGALASGQTSQASVAVGHSSLNATTGSFETAIGYQTGRLSTGGGVAFAAGYNALSGLTTGSGIAIGVNTGANATTATDILIIGTNSDVSNVGSAGEIVVGHGLTAKGNNTAFIGGTAGAYNGKNVTTWETVSDERIKRNIVDAGKGLTELMQLRVRNFQYKEETDMPKDEFGTLMASGLNPEKQITGFVAQEIRAVLPECVTENSNGLLSVSVDPVIYVMIKAIQDLKAELDTYKSTHP
jgi:hypothetical protein